MEKRYIDAVTRYQDWRNTMEKIYGPMIYARDVKAVPVLSDIEPVTGNSKTGAN